MLGEGRCLGSSSRSAAAKLALAGGPAASTADAIARQAAVSRTHDLQVVALVGAHRARGPAPRQIMSGLIPACDFATTHSSPHGRSAALH
jgi:hypothetical protein